MRYDDSGQQDTWLRTEQNRGGKRQKGGGGVSGKQREKQQQQTKKIRAFVGKAKRHNTCVLSSSLLSVLVRTDSPGCSSWEVP